MRAVDTKVLVRLITRDDARQTASAENFIDKGAWVSTLVLAETMWVLGAVYELNCNAQVKAIEMLLDHHDLVLHDREIVVAALELFRGRPMLGFSDCLVIESARRAGHLPLGTFDRSLAKVEGTRKL
jgi:predicted nucleic-acid-binding protein